MKPIEDFTIASARQALLTKEVSALELTRYYLKQIKKHNPKLNAFITVSEYEAEVQAETADIAIKNNNIKPLTGIPLAIKDLFCTDSVRTTAGSKMLENFIPKYESTVTTNLLRDGAVFLGKTNLDEFAMGSSNTTSYFGPAINPWIRNDGKLLVPGGSSGGSAAAIAARLALGATATDTGGSIRQPSSFCGIVGIKPTYGRCSRYGIIAYASSLDQAGPMAQTVEDCAILLQSMASYDHKDSTSIDILVPDYVAACKSSIKGLKIGIPKEYQNENLSPEITKMWEDGIKWLIDAGAEIIDISLPHTKYGLATYYIIAPAEASSNLARYDGVRYGLRVNGEDLIDMYEKTRAAGFGEEVKRRILMGTYVLSAGYYDAFISMTWFT